MHGARQITRGAIEGCGRIPSGAQIARRTERSRDHSARTGNRRQLEEPRRSEKLIEPGVGRPRSSSPQEGGNCPRSGEDPLPDRDIEGARLGTAVPLRGERTNSDPQARSRLRERRYPLR